MITTEVYKQDFYGMDEDAFVNYMRQYAQNLILVNPFIKLNPFEVLELGSEPVPLETVTAQYHKLARKYHPDMPAGDADRMTLINGAYTFITTRIVLPPSGKFIE